MFETKIYIIVSIPKHDSYQEALYKASAFLKKRKYCHKNKVLNDIYFLKMMKLFQKVQARKTVVFAPKLKNGEVKEPKQIAQKKRVPRYLTRDIILKLKKTSLFVVL